MDLCIDCKERPILIKKRGLCSRCYEKLKRTEGPLLPRLREEEASCFQGYERISKVTRTKEVHLREVTFIQNYFTHQNWQYQATIFRLPVGNYTPDFYDAERNVFIEVSGTRQAYHQNKEKYESLKKLYPQLTFEIRSPTGELINTGEDRINWH